MIIYNNVDRGKQWKDEALQVQETHISSYGAELTVCLAAFILARIMQFRSNRTSRTRAL
jgi:hypothetical protein